MIDLLVQCEEDKSVKTRKLPPSKHFHVYSILLFFAGADPYCVISCEGEKVRTRTVEDTTSPVWNETALFYRKKPIKKPIKIQVVLNLSIR